MPKELKKRVQAMVNEHESIYNATAQLFEDAAKLQQIKNACGYLTRIAKPGAKHVQKFIDRVFGIVGFQREAKPKRPVVVRKRSTRTKPAPQQAAAAAATGD